jgi:uncharacterized membrane protein YczE
MNRVTRFLLSLLFYCLTGVGISLTIRAGVGVSSFNSLNVALAEGFHVTAGWVTVAMNGLFLVISIALDRPKRPGRYALQAAAILCLGRVIDLFTYGVFGSLSLASYPARLMLFVLGTVLGGASTGAVLSLEALAFPIERACQQVAERAGQPFRRVRYALDALFVTGSLALSLALKLPLFVREGTLISLFLLTASISAAKKACDRRARRACPSAALCDMMGKTGEGT